jgi:lipopolysaccharide O-acetyltransferase
VSEFEGLVFSPSIQIGRGFRASQRVHISAIESIIIGDDCLFGSNIYVADHAHGNYRSDGQSSPDTNPAQRPLAATGAVAIGERVWVGDNVVILGGVTIGSGSIVAANSVVTRDIPAGSMAAGSPARVIKQFETSTNAWLPVPDRPISTNH